MLVQSQPIVLGGDQHHQDLYWLCRDVEHWLYPQGLAPYKQYAYQFSWSKHKSIVGQTRTLSDGRQEEMRFACVCCSNFREL